MKLHFEHDFGLNASHKESTAVGVYLPEVLDTWLDRDGSKVTFYPFLVVVARPNTEKAIWMPYWHVVEKAGRGPANKYGQWAPHMRISLFENLISKARADGQLTT
ncbi:MAG: hypothetical protein ACHQ50_09955 [Fimbriimonadales bacterium]